MKKQQNIFREQTKTLLGLVFLIIVSSYITACNKNDSNSSSEEIVVIPKAPDYEDDTMWYRLKNDREGTGADIFYIVSTWEFDWKDENGNNCYYADVWNAQHRSDMNIEQSKVADYMADGNDFYAPYYRHMTLESWATLNEDTIARRTQLSMGDVKQAFDYFQAHRDQSRPFILAGFSQGGKAVVELMKYIDDETYNHVVAAYVLGYKVTPTDTTETTHFVAAQSADDLGVTICYNTVKDVKYIQPIVAAPCVMCINPVNWHTDSEPATLADTITISVDTDHHVLVAQGYAATEYKPILGILNVGDIHSCEPWLYSECLRENMKLRIKKWRELHQ